MVDVLITWCIINTVGLLYLSLFRLQRVKVNASAGTKVVKIDRHRFTSRKAPKK